MFCTDLVICLCMLTERPSTSSSILWRVLLWQMIADHGRVCCGITSLQSHPRLPITHTLRHPCRLLFIRLRQALTTIPVSHFHPCSPPMRRFLGLVIRQYLPYPTIPTTRAEGKCRSLCLACVRQRMGPFFWHLLPMPVLPEFTTITLLLHTPLIIIGAADVAFNRLCSCLVFMPSYELRAFDFVSSLPALHNLIVLQSSIFLHARIQTTFCILDSFNSSTSHVIFPTIPSEAISSFSIALCITPLGLISRFTIVHVQHDAIIIWVSAPGTNFRDAGE